MGIHPYETVLQINAEKLTCNFYVYALSAGYFSFTYDLDRCTMHPKFDPTRVRNHDLQIMDKTCHVPKMLVLITEPSGIKTLPFILYRSSIIIFCVIIDHLEVCHNVTMVVSLHSFRYDVLQHFLPDLLMVIAIVWDPPV